MLDLVQDAALRSAAAAELDVELLSIATANPPHRLSQHEAAARARDLFPRLGRLWPVYDSIGVDLRYNCEPIEWYLKPHSWEERTASFRKHAIDLLEQVTRGLIESAGVDLGCIDAIVTNTVTGLAIPSLDAMLLNRLKLSPRVERLPMFGLGCGAGVAGLSRAARMAQARDGACVLFLTVDLCSLCLRVNDASPAMFVSSALFGDGAAGVLLHNTRRDSRGGVRLRAGGEWCWRGTERIMGWDIMADGFGIVLSAELPALMQSALPAALDDFLIRNCYRVSDFNGFLFHPGSRKLLETVEQCLNLDRARLVHSWDVLREFGNMSSATVLFVLERALRAGARGPHLMAAFGPGFSAYFAVADL